MFFTERLCLRGFQDEDKEKMINMMIDPRVAPNINIGFWRPVKPGYGDILKKAYETGFWSSVAVTREGNEFVGMLMLHMPAETPNRNPELSICIAYDHQSKGYGGEMLRFLLKHAFTELGMHRVYLEVLEGNVGAISLYKRCGFVQEGRLRKHLWKSGKWIDLIQMGILKEEWEELQSPTKASSKPEAVADVGDALPSGQLADVETDWFVV